MTGRGGLFVTEGTLAQGAACYVVRQADQDLYEALLEGEFAYVLDSRQKGKSSLMIRTRERLERAGVRTILLDLQRFGSNLDPERWYASLLSVVGEQLGIDERLFDLWDEQVHAGPMRKFFGALEKGLEELGGRFVVFVDEIDFVRSLPFSTDEFFAGIRESYNRRAHSLESAVEPAHSKVTFCLLGVATPSELIRDVRITPFNIGRRIELTDFTLDELAPYEAPLSTAGRNGQALLRRIHYWTNGHPYLTQKLAAAVAADETVKTPGGVDRLVETLFFSLKARTDEPNLSDVARRVLESPIEGVSPEEARARILDLYRQVRDSRVRDDDTDPVVSVLKLSGLTRVLEGYLVVRNRVYFRAFDRSWVEANLPEAEALRQKRAARRAAMRVGLIAGSVAVAIGALAVFGFVKANSEAAAKADARRATVLAEARRAAAEEANKRTELALETAEAEKERADEKAEEARKANEETKVALARATQEKQNADRERNRAVAAKNEADRERKKADALAKQEKQTADRERLARQATDRLLYQANMNLIQTAFEANQFGRVQELLDEAAKPAFAAFRGPEWGYWDYRMNTHLLALKGHTGAVSTASFSPDGSRIVTASSDGTARVWDARDGRELAALKGHTRQVRTASFSPDGSRIVTASVDGTARVWDARDGREIAALKGHRDQLWTASFSPDGSRIVTASVDGTARVWDARDGREIAALKGHTRQVRTASFSPDGSRIVTASLDSTARVWDGRDGREVAALKGHTDAVWDASFSPDGARIVSASGDRTARVWDARDGREIAALKGYTLGVSAASFSPDGRYLLLATGSEARIVPLDREAAAKLTFVRQEAWVAERLAESASAGDAFAWRWQTQHWLTPELAKTEALQDVFYAAIDSPDASVVADTRSRLTRLPIERLRTQTTRAAAQARWTELSTLLAQIASDPRATMTERKSLALVRLHLGDLDGWRRAARAAVTALKSDAPASDVLQSAIAARAAPGALDDYGPLLQALERAAGSDPERFARAASPGALLFRAGRYAEAEKRLQPAVEGESPSRFGQVFLAMTLSKLGRADEAKALLAQFEGWTRAKPARGDAPTNLAAQTWDFRLELELLLAEAREMLGLPKPDSLLGMAEQALTRWNQRGMAQTAVMNWVRSSASSLPLRLTPLQTSTP